MLKVTCDNCQVSLINGIACHEQGCHGLFLYTDHGRKYRKFRVFSLDVWRTTEGGFEVNDRSERGSILVTASLDNRAIVRALKKKDFLGRYLRMASIEIDGEEGLLYINDKKTGEPILQLEGV